MNSSLCSYLFDFFFYMKNTTPFITVFTVPEVLLLVYKQIIRHRSQSQYLLPYIQTKQKNKSSFHIRPFTDTNRTSQIPNLHEWYDFILTVGEDFYEWNREPRPQLDVSYLGQFMIHRTSQKLKEHRCQDRVRIQKGL